MESEDVMRRVGVVVDKSCAEKWFTSWGRCRR